MKWYRNYLYVKIPFDCSRLTIKWVFVINKRPNGSSLEIILTFANYSIWNWLYSFWHYPLHTQYPDSNWCHCKLYSPLLPYLHCDRLLLFDIPLMCYYSFFTCSLDILVLILTQVLHTSRLQHLVHLCLLPFNFYSFS